MAMFKLDGPSIMINGGKHMVRLASGNRYVTGGSSGYCRRLAATLFMQLVDENNTVVFVFYQKPMPNPKPHTVNPAHFVLCAVCNECDECDENGEWLTEVDGEWFAEVVDAWLPKAVVKCLGP